MVSEVSRDPVSDNPLEWVAKVPHSGRLGTFLPSPPMPRFLTVKEAATLTGKSSSSIRRVIYPVIEHDQHADREHIAPSVEEVKQLRMKGENFAWKISEELLRREVPMETETDTGSKTSNPKQGSDGNSELLAMLRRELDIKNNQITQQSEMISKQMELISGLSERLREGNILMGSLQQQLTLPEGSSRKTSEVVDASTQTASPEQRSQTTKKTLKQKKGLFSRFFR